MNAGARAAGVLVLLAAFTHDVWAQEKIPAGKFGFLAGLRQHSGGLGEDYGFGYLIGLSAGYQPPLGDSRFSFGGDWGVLWGRFQSDSPELVLEELFLVEMHVGLKFRAALSGAGARFLAVGGGYTLLRADTAIPPDDKKVYMGPYASLGIDQYLARRYLVALEARYGLIGQGPSSLTLLLSFHFGV